MIQYGVWQGEIEQLCSQSHIAMGTQGVNTTLFCAGSQALIPGHQYSVDSPFNKWNSKQRIEGKRYVLCG